MSGKKILYNGEEYADFSTIAQGVGEFTSNSGVKDPTSYNNEIFNDYLNNVANGNYSHTEGSENETYGYYSHAEGLRNFIKAGAAHIEGYLNRLSYSNFSEETSYTVGDIVLYLNELYQCKEATSGSWNPEKWDNFSTFTNSYILNSVNNSNRYINGAFGTASISSLHVEGATNLLIGQEGSHIEGRNNIAQGITQHAEGLQNTLYAGDSCHIEGKYNTTIIDNTPASGSVIHIEGLSNKANGLVSHTEGYDNTNKSDYTHVEGQRNNVNGGSQNHIEGAGHSVTSASCNHVEGYGHIVSQNNQYGHVEGCENITNQNVSYYHVGGQGNIVTANHQTLIGKYGIPGSYAFVIGNGSGTSDRSNALTVDWNGVLNAQGVLNTQVDVQINNNSIMTNFAPAYDGTATYPANSFCTYLGKLYTNPSAITTAEPDFISSHWNETTLSTIQSGNSSSIGGLGTAIGDIWRDLGPLTGPTGKVAVLETNVSNHETRITALEQGGSSTVDAIVTNSSDEYNTSATYNVGDYCIYNNILYKCIATVTAEATFDPDKWAATTIISVLNVLNQRLAALEALPNLDNEPL